MHVDFVVVRAKSTQLKINSTQNRSKKQIEAKQSKEQRTRNANQVADILPRVVASSVFSMSEEHRISMYSGGHFNAASLLLAPSVSDANPNASTSAAPAREDPATY